MNIIHMSIRRPVAVAMLYLAVAAVGLYFFKKLPLEQLPTTYLPSLTINTVWQFTPPEIVEAFVTSPIEGIANTVKGVKEVSSTSYEGLSTVRASFVQGVDLDFAKMELNEKLTALQNEFPSNVGRPNVIGSSVSSRTLGLDKPLPLQYYVTGNYTLAELRQYALDNIETPLQGIDGVSEVEVIGGQPRLIKVEIDRKKAEMFGIRESMLSSEISSMEIKRNAGYIYRGSGRYDVFIENTAETLDDVKKLRIRNYRGELIPITHIASITDDFDEPFSHYRINGNPRVTLQIEQEEGTNTLKFSQAVEAKLEELKAGFPPSLQIIKDYDPSTRIERELANIEWRAVICIIFIVAVLYLFLWNVKVPLLILSTIFFSELITIILFYAFDIGFNIMTIAGLALGFGMLVDSSIVVIDNIFRYKERGESSIVSAEKGAREVFLPIVASVLTTSIVFIPFLYLTGDNRLLYFPMAMAVVFSLISSVLVAFTFIPTFALKVFPEDAESVRESIKKNRFLPQITGLYSRFIEFAIHKKYWTVATAVLLFAGSIYVYDKTSPSFYYGGISGQDTYIYVSIRLPKGAELDQANAIAEEFENMTLGREYIKKVSANVQPERVSIRVEFSDKALETAFPYVLKDELTGYAATFAGVSISVSGVGDYFSSGGLGASSGYNFQIKIYGYNYNRVARIAEDMGRYLERIPRVHNIDTKGSGWRSSEIYESVIIIKRDELSAYDLDVQTVINQVDRYLRGNVRRTSVKIGGEEVQFAVKVKDFERFQLDELKNVVISVPNGAQVRLSKIAEITEQRTMEEIRRNKQQYERLVNFEYRGPAKMGQSIVDSIIDGWDVPNGYSIESGMFYMMQREEKIELWMVIAFAVLLVYMMTASLYESLIHPLVIILTVPMALIGVYLAFFFAGQTFDSSAYIGVILLAGIVVNNSIILVDHINLLRRKGMYLYAAVIQGCKDRIRPILMTSTTTILGLTPLILFSSATRGYGRQWYLLSLASIGGLISSTPLTLSVIPVLYILFEEWRRAFRNHLMRL